MWLSPAPAAVRPPVQHVRLQPVGLASPYGRDFRLFLRTLDGPNAITGFAAVLTALLLSTIEEMPKWPERPLRESRAVLDVAMRRIVGMVVTIFRGHGALSWPGLQAGDIWW